MTTRKPDFVYVTYIASTPEKVFRALQDPEQTRTYWFLKKNVSSWQPGEKWSHQEHDTGEVWVEGKVLECDPPRKLVLTWGWPAGHPGSGERPSKVTFLLESYEGATRLTVTHDELVPGSEMEKGINAGWPAVLSALKTWLETGQPMEMMSKRRTRPPE